ncbi:hypothetical protein GR160_04045 [Flavobacterium sp. Sd200]|uniref:hypothetical protein n=1 Tax=Flavobacterium sp. Sd200 TaxID=2692211 RepID=UPI00136B80A9|nr:hypothetical protein [Flavobacterium sp. Sd200]MXN90388.1 hypothetical protein [Flavobacterium sp. Sd200]
MNIAELKLQLINKIMTLDDAEFALKAEKLLNDESHSVNEKGSVPDSTIIAYRSNGQPLSIKDLKTEILQITDDTKSGAHCSTKTRLKGILWL